MTKEELAEVFCNSNKQANTVLCFIAGYEIGSQRYEAYIALLEHNLRQLKNSYNSICEQLEEREVK